ncbi:uncharacterized protein LOC110981794 isoform X2 [Acanthaster planci]|uniref:Uncharacterized protein LOC110981794 isoform X2 n=1 Tax=Acanthaster planci TaxID=133434 RepID=A0A8B7YVR2_ACAPL|nr:uncharacterized protein LOC110981794 isoform X2 [Acanthaster planci]
MQKAPHFKTRNSRENCSIMTVPSVFSKLPIQDLSSDMDRQIINYLFFRKSKTTIALKHHGPTILATKNNKWDADAKRFLKFLRDDHQELEWWEFMKKPLPLLSKKHKKTSRNQLQIPSWNIRNQSVFKTTRKEASACSKCCDTENEHYGEDIEKRASTRMQEIQNLMNLVRGPPTWNYEPPRPFTYDEPAEAGFMLKRMYM